MFPKGWPFGVLMTLQMVRNDGAFRKMQILGRKFMLAHHTVYRPTLVRWYWVCGFYRVDLILQYSTDLASAFVRITAQNLSSWTWLCLHSIRSFGKIYGNQSRRLF